MLLITKRSGGVEPYDPEKVKSSIADISDEVGQPLNESDLNSIIRELGQMLEGKESATTRQIYVILVGILYTRGRQKVLERYVGYAKNAWR